MTSQETKEFSCGTGRKLPGTSCNGLELQFVDTQFTHKTPAGTSDDGPLAAPCRDAKTDGGAFLVYVRHYQLFRSDWSMGVSEW